MTIEQSLAEELNEMINEDNIPLSITEDIHEITARLQRGEMMVSDLKGMDVFIEEKIKEAMQRLQR
ncbi:hypothetical protein ACFSCX_20655 [Bacillus salitolerans]|uniref:Uncharacterized protein n=1 Tax=Bacillus salitolerans TaxID=1437434 RepID=A0ABW4LWY2_9BACI